MKHNSFKSKNQIGSILFLLIIMTIAFTVLLRGYSYKQLITSLKNINLVFFIPGACMMLVYLGCGAFNYYQIMRMLEHPVRLKRCIQYSCIGFYFNSITPAATGGQPAQMYYMNKDKIPVTVSSMTLFFTIYVYQTAMVLLGAAASLLRYPTAVYAAGRLKYFLWIGAAVNTGIIFILIFFMFSKKIISEILFFFLRLGAKLKLIKKEEEMKIKLERSLTTYHIQAIVIKKHPGLFFRVLLVSVLQLTALNLIPYMVYRSLDFQGNLLDFLTCQSLLTITLGAIPLPGSEGFVESAFLHVFDLYFPGNIIKTAMIINRVISFYLPLLFSFFLYLFVHLRTMKKTAMHSDSSA